MDELVLPSEITLPNELQETKEAKEERLFLHFIGPCATVFGSAQFPETHPYYLLARQVGAELAKAGFTVMAEVDQGSWKQPTAEQRTID